MWMTLDICFSKLFRFLKFTYNSQCNSCRILYATGSMNQRWKYVHCDSHRKYTTIEATEPMKFFLIDIHKIKTNHFYIILHSNKMYKIVHRQTDRKFKNTFFSKFSKFWKTMRCVSSDVRLWVKYMNWLCHFAKKRINF